MWFPIALFEAFANSLTSPINKYQVKTIHPIALLFLNQCFSIACMFILILLLGGIPHVTSKFFIFMFYSSILDTGAFIASYWAIRHTQISLLAPLGSLTPIFATIFGLLFLHEVPSPLKLLGITGIVIGIYLLNISEISGGLLKPFKRLLSDKGVKLYFIPVILYGITPIFQKQAIFQIHPSMPLFASFIGNCFVTLFLSLYAVRFVKKEKNAIMKNRWLFLLFGILNTFSQLAAYIVFSITHIGYATAIFSLSSLFTILLGGIFFKENNIGERLIGALVIICGVALLAI